MDPKLYKTLKQLVKLGIINNNGKVKKVRRRRNKRKSTTSSSIYGLPSQPTNHLMSNAVYSSPSQTIQSEQALVNLKASEAQLERALNSKSLPYEYKDDVLLALAGIQRELKLKYVDNDKLNSNFNDAYGKLDGIVDTKVKQALKTIDYNATSGINTYNNMVPQTTMKNNMNSRQGINRDGPDITINTSNDNIENAKAQYTEDTVDKPIKINSKPMRIKKKIERFSPNDLSKDDLIKEYATKSNIPVSKARIELKGKQAKTIQKLVNQMQFTEVFDSDEELERELMKDQVLYKQKS